MPKVNPLEIIDSELAKSRTVKSTGNRQIFLYLKPGHTALIRPLYELNKCLPLLKHDVYEAGNSNMQVTAICASEIEQDCLHCFNSENENNKKLTANYRIYLPIYVYKVVDEQNADVFQEEIDETGQKINRPIQGVKILELGMWGKISQVLQFFREYMKKAPITQADFSLYHIDGATKYFKLTEKRQKEMDSRIKSITPTLDVVKEYILLAYPPAAFTNEHAEKYLETVEEEDTDLLPNNFTPL